MSTSLNYKINLNPMLGFERNLSQIDSSSPPQALKKCYKLWAVRYYSETKRKFKDNSRGGGDWKPLAASTLRQKNNNGKGKKKGNKTSILIRTGTLMATLGVKAVGSKQDFVTGGIRLSFDGVRHPAGGKATIKDIANYHQAGAGRLPKRQIFNEPSIAAVRGMQEDFLKAVVEMGTK